MLAALFLEINAGVILLMIVCLFAARGDRVLGRELRQLTREVNPIEQHVHSLLEMLPLIGPLMVVVLHWDQFLSLFGLASASFALRR